MDRDWKVACIFAAQYNGGKRWCRGTHARRARCCRLGRAALGAGSEQRCALGQWTLNALLKLIVLSYSTQLVPLLPQTLYLVACEFTPQYTYWACREACMHRTMKQKSGSSTSAASTWTDRLANEGHPSVPYSLENNVRMRRRIGRHAMSLPRRSPSAWFIVACLIFGLCVGVINGDGPLVDPEGSDESTTFLPATAHKVSQTTVLPLTPGRTCAELGWAFAPGIHLNNTNVYVPPFHLVFVLPARRGPALLWTVVANEQLSRTAVCAWRDVRWESSCDVQLSLTLNEFLG